MLTNFLTRISRWFSQARPLLWNEIGAFVVTNKQFATPEMAWIPANHQELADITMIGGTVTTATVNTGIVGNRWARMRVHLKTLTGLSAADTVRITMQAGTGAAITGPVQIGQGFLVMTTSDTVIEHDFYCWSQTGFQSYAITMTASAGGATCVADIMVDVA